LSFFLTPMVRRIALLLKVVDRPNERRLNKMPIPRLGGLAVAASFFVIVLLFGGLDKHLWGFLAGTAILLFFAVWDDLKNLSPLLQFTGQALAALMLVISGIGVNEISNPLGGALRLDGWQIPLVFFGTTYHLTVWADLLTFVWVVGMVNVLNFLDGLDGLAGGVAAIAAMTLFGLSLAPQVAQLSVALLTLALAGAALGFLPFNFHPAKIFLGSAGSWFLGFTLATLAIISGGKIATAFLVLGFPILDGLWVAIRRLTLGLSPLRGDQRHLHHQLLAIGLSQSRAAVLLYILCAGFGVAALFASSQLKLIAILVLLATMSVLSAAVLWMARRHLSLAIRKKNRAERTLPEVKELKKF